MQWLQAITELKLPPLVSGNHGGGPTTGLCAMEMVAFMERLPHSDKPECTCQVIGAFTIAINDTLDDKERQKLLPVLPELVDTVVPCGDMKRREEFFREQAHRSFAWRYERGLDHERDYYRGRHRDACHKIEQLRRMLTEGPGGAIRVIAECSPPFQLADILIGMLRDALKIGQPQTRKEFRLPERVEELATIEYSDAPDSKQFAKYAAMKMPVGSGKSYMSPFVVEPKFFS